MLIVEDGTCIPEADSYVTVDDVTAVSVRFGDLVWAGLDVDKQEIACRVGSAYVDHRYIERLNGVKQCQDAILEWPRVGATTYLGGEILENVVPVAVKRATIEAVLLHVNGTTLLPDVEGGPNLTSKSVANGAISKSWDKDSYGNLPLFKKIEALLYSLYGPSPNSKTYSTSVSLRRGT